MNTSGSRSYFSRASLACSQLYAWIFDHIRLRIPAVFLNFFKQDILSLSMNVAVHNGHNDV